MAQLSLSMVLYSPQADNGFYNLIILRGGGKKPCVVETECVLQSLEYLAFTGRACDRFLGGNVDDTLSLKVASR